MSRRKKSNLLKRRTAIVRGTMRNYKIAIVRLGDDQLAMSWGNLRPAIIGANLARDINELDHPWVVTIVVLFKDQDGKRCFKAYETAPPHPCRSDQITSSLEAQEQAARGEVNPNHTIIRTAWVATPYAHSFDNAQLDRLMEDLDAWDDTTMLQGE